MDYNMTLIFLPGGSSMFSVVDFDWLFWQALFFFFFKDPVAVPQI